MWHVNLEKDWAVLTTSYVQMLGRSSLPWLIFRQHFTTLTPSFITAVQERLVEVTWTLILSLCLCDCFIWLELEIWRERATNNRTWNQWAVCSEHLFKTDGLDHAAVRNLLFMCYEWYDKMLSFLRITNGKSFISPQKGILLKNILYHFT